MTQPTVAIVILNYNGVHYLQKFLPSVLSCSAEYARVIVADNASTDNSLALLRESFPSVELIILDRNYGFAGGYNKALEQVKSDYYVLLNSDVEVSRGWIEPIITLMESDKAIAACQPKLLSYHEPELFEYAGGAGGWIDYLGYPFSRGRVFEVCEKDVRQYNSTAPVFWASGAAMFVRASVFQDCRGFDAYFFAHMEEIDLCWRMQLKGHKIMSCPASVVYHVGGGTLPKGNERKVYLNFRNNLIMLCKNLPWQERIWKLPLRFFLDILFACKNLFTGYPKSFTAVLKAHVSVVKWRLLHSLKAPYTKRPFTTLTGVYNRSIVWNYFVNNMKKFSDIIGNK
ncbi:glycosyltransferase family 2 protein [Danxiaibacter flavus]|uniref:Glycosyltransferase family 2 protein n=1 Tax=Danxiaibacter flavus TaxID=3049108 RepID=A0ABV3ZBX6_9BACT|nr:glycosyltransferase family 2 protein [Chitinophagaceae bacterium DXS]